MIPEESFNLILSIQRGEFLNMPPTLRERIEATLPAPNSEAHQTASAKHIHFALAAFVDETIMRSGQPWRVNWHRLQTEYYDTLHAGQAFFHKLDALDADAHSLSPALEVYYLCLLLGFRGKLGVQSAHLRQKKIDDYYQQIRTRAKANETAHGQQPFGDRLVTQNRGWTVATVVAYLGVMIITLLLMLIL